jgi:hypothetical protein
VTLDFRLSKARAEYLTAALSYGRPIAPTNNETWSPDDVLTLAGAGLFAALRHGPRGYRCASEADFTADLHETIGRVAKALARAAEGAHDQGLEHRQASQCGGRMLWPVSNPLYYSPRCGPQAPTPWP